MKKIYVFIGSILLFTCFNIICVKALPTTLGPIDQVGSNVTDSCGGNSCYGLALKVSGSTPVLCTEYNKTTPAAGNATCSINSNWNEKVRYGVAAIINKASSSINASSITNQYFAAEMAVNKFLHDKGAGGADIAGTALTSTYSSLYQDYLNAANSAYNSYDTDSSISITLSANSLTFTLNGSNYESNSVTVSGVDSYSAVTNLGTISKTGQTFKVIVPESSVTKNETVQVTITATKTLNQARNYSCGEIYQSITPVALDKVDKTATKAINGSISPKAKLTINKVDGDNKHLSGATILVTGPNNYSQTFTTTGESIVIEGLEYGSYTIKETKTPTGYVGAKEKTVVLSTENLTETVVLTNNKNKVVISKLDVTGKKELPGATLEIQDEEGNIVKFCTDSEGNKNTECKWVSTDKPYEIEGFPVGKYYLQETIAPEGYVLRKERLLFEVKEDVLTTEVIMENELEVEVPDTLSSRSALLLTIAMFDIALGIGIVTYVKKHKIEE